VGRRAVVALALVGAVGCSGEAAVPEPAPAPAPTTSVALPVSAVPVAVPGTVRLGAVEIDRAGTGSVEVRPARRAVTFGRTELRGNAAWELTGDTCGGRTLRPQDPPCRLEVTVLPRATGDLAARLVLPWDRGTLAVPLSATVPLSYTVVLTVLGRGSVTGDRAGITCSGRCTARVAQGSVLTLTATGTPRWSGPCAGSQGTCRVTVAAPLDITADFR
jgi:hypothetical protein